MEGKLFHLLKILPEVALFAARAEGPHDQAPYLRRSAAEGVAEDAFFQEPVATHNPLPHRRRVEELDVPVRKKR